MIHKPYANSKQHQVRVKIGHSVDPKNRRDNLQVGAPGEIVLWYSFLVNKESAAKLEHELHRKFRWSKTRGEWFKMHSSIRQWVKQHKQGVIYPEQEQCQLPQAVSFAHAMIRIPKKERYGKAAKERKKIMAYMETVKISEKLAKVF